MFKNWQPVDIIVGCLTLVVGVGLISGIIGVVIIRYNGEDYNEGATDRLFSAYSGIVNLISMFLGAKLQQSIDSRNLRP